MSEILPPESDIPSPPLSEELSRQAEWLRSGLDSAQAVGFNFQGSVEQNYPGMEAEALMARRDAVFSRATEMAHEAQLDASFFHRPANTVLLLSVADSWIANEARAASGDHDPKVAAERDMLADTLLIVAGNQSGIVRDAVQAGSPEAQAKYTNLAASEEGARFAEFAESINDHELTAQMEQLLHSDGPNALLAQQREQLGVTAETQRPFRVRVLRIAKAKYDLKMAGLIPEDPTPKVTSAPDMTDADILALKEDSARVNAEYAVQDAAAEPYLRASQELAKRFGPMADAFMSIDGDGDVTLTFNAVTAKLILNHLRDNMPIPEDVQHDVSEALAVARHEYAHTQRPVTLGAESQLGLIIEERKAELVSGDRLGYLGVKYLIEDLGIASGVNILDMIQGAIKTDDAASTFVVDAANQLGLRDALLLMAAVPKEYEVNPSHNSSWPNTHCIRTAGDVSVADAILREEIGRRGDETLVRNMGAWAASLAGLQPDSEVVRQVVGSRVHSGVTVTHPHRAAAVKQLVKYTHT